MAVRRVLIVMEEGSAAEILSCDHTRSADHSYLVSQVIEISLARGASLAWYDLEESSAKTTRISSLFACQASDSRLIVNGNNLFGGRTRNEYKITADGDATDTELSGMVIASGCQLTDNNTSVVHSGRHGSSRQLFKYVVDDDASGAFEGLIKVDAGAEHTEAFQTNRNLLASYGSRMHTRPQLLINCDEVKCSHGATTGRLDEQALFYMRQRGIPFEEARIMLMQAFMADVIDMVKLEGLRDRLRYLVEKRFSGSRVLCSQCQAQGVSAEGGGLQ
ncbi:MAG: SufD family Fe-S cluster assembly protein [Muribaculaceae bacterium]|nr:SufD family Fe-S cluster assembly protein [Muribaculaceae bacterium]